MYISKTYIYNNNGALEFSTSEPTLPVSFDAGVLQASVHGAGGEIGHLRLSEDGPIGFGKAGSFEGFCSGGGIAQLGKIMTKEKLEKGETVAFCKDETELDKINAKLIALNEVTQFAEGICDEA